jgi:hypothetical protein
VKKTSHPIDDIFLEGLAEEQDMPSFPAWENIEQSLDKNAITAFETKHNQLQKIIIILLVLLASITFYTIKTHKSASVEKVNTPIAVDAKKIVPTIVDLNETTIPIKIKSSTPIVANKKITDNAIVLHPKVGTNPTLSAFKKNTNKIKLVSEKNTNIITPTNKVIPAEFQAPSIQMKASSKQTKGNLAHSIQINPPSKNTAVDNKSIIPDLPIHQNDIIQQLNGSNENEMSDKDKIYHLAPLGIGKADRNILVGLSIPSKISTQVTLLLQENNDKFHISDAQVQASILKEKPKMHWSILPIISVNTVSTYIAATEVQSSRREYLRKQITESEKASLSIVASVSIEVDLNKRFSLETGIGYYEKNTTIKQRTITAEKDREGKVKYRFDCSVGTYYINPKLGVTPNIGDSTKSFYAENKLQYITLPFIVKYHFITGKINWFQLIGGGINMLVGQNLTTEIDNRFSEKLEKIKTRDLNKTYYTALVGAGIDYSLSKRVAFRISPAYRFSLTPINKNENFKTYPNSFSVMGGFKIALGH